MSNVPNSATDVAIGEVAEVEAGVVEWTVRDFFSLPVRVGDRYVSSSFPLHGARWRFAMLPNGEKRHESEGCIDVYCRRDSSGSPIQLSFSFGLKTSKGELAQETQATRYFGEQFDSFGCSRFLLRHVLRERKFELAPLGHVTWVWRTKRPPSNAIPSAKCTHCKEIVDTGKFPLHERKCLDKPVKCPECSETVALKHWHAHECQAAKSKDIPSEPVVRSKVLQDLDQLFQNQENCDVVLRVKGREFPAHRIILTARSSVFASAFRSDMKEKATGVVDIEDCEPSTFSSFLRFLYSGDVEGLSSENVFSLYFAADKYDVSDLREKCLRFMKENLSVDTFCDTLTVALRHSETELVRLATAFFVANADKITVTVAWQIFVAENPTEGNELFVKFVSASKR